MSDADAESRRRCRATREDGNACGAPSTFVGEDGWCPAHRPGNREKIREAARKGAAARHGKGTDDSEPDGLAPEELPSLETHADAKAWLDTLGRAVATGRLRERPAQAAIRAVSEWVKAHGEELVAEDVERLRDRLETLEGELQRRDRPWE